MINRKILYTVMCTAFIACVFTGCGKSSVAEAPASTEKDVVVATVDSPDQTTDSIPTVNESGVGNAVTGDGSVAAHSASLIDASSYNLDCVFEDKVTWNTTIQDIENMEGISDNTYDSVYGGTTYTYPKEYLGKNGTIKYMFDDRDALMCVAWTGTTDDFDSLSELYDTIHSQLVSSYGESGYNTSQDTNGGDVWYREEGDILVSSMATDSLKAVQFAYLNPIISKVQMENAAKDKASSK